MAISSTRPNTLPALQRALVVGGGGREQALAWALARCPGLETVWITPGTVSYTHLTLPTKVYV